MQLAQVTRGTGPTVVLVHGTPSSSFEFREVIAELSADHHCVAPDHLGFGASPKPVDGDYSLSAHQQRFAAFLDANHIEDAVFVLHDFGAAIAMPALLDRPERCRGIVLLNSFLWRATGPAAWIMALYATPVGQWVYRTFNLSVGVLLPFAWGRRKPLTPELKASYQRFLASSDDRRSTAALPGELVGPTLGALEGRLGELEQFPKRMVWGMADRVVGPAELQRWCDALPGIEVDRLDDVGHFVAEEAPDAVADAVRALEADIARSAILELEAG